MIGNSNWIAKNSIKNNLQDIVIWIDVQNSV